MATGDFCFGCHLELTLKRAFFWYMFSGEYASGRQGMHYPTGGKKGTWGRTQKTWIFIMVL